MTKGHAGQIKKAVQLLLDAKRPMIYTGGGVILNNAAPQLTRLVRLLGHPCTNTLMGLGGFPGTDPQFTGLPGMHGTYETNMAMQHCDVLFAVGVRFDDRVIGDPKHFYRADRKIIHIDIDPSSISKRVKVDVPIVGYVADVIEEMLKLFESSPQRPDAAALKAWWAQIKEWQHKDCLKYDRKSALIKPQYVIEKLYEITKGDAFITSDVGQHQMWAAQYYKFDKPRRWINSGGLGTMGFGLPAAMGVQLVNPQRDGCVRDRRGVDPDVHPGALHLQAVPPADQDRELEQPLHGHGPAVAGVLLRQPVRRVVHGRAAGFRASSPKRTDTSASRSRSPATSRARSREAVGAKGSARLPRFHHRPDRERLSDGAGRQRVDGNDPGRGAVGMSGAGRSQAANCSPVGAGAAATAASVGDFHMMRHILSILVENEAGALSRISGLFSARGYNIESLTVAPTEDPTMSRMTIVTIGSDDVDRADHQAIEQAGRGRQGRRPDRRATTSSAS